MRTLAKALISLAAIVFLALPATLASAQDASNSVVIVFKDGHRQTISVAAIDRLEFSGPVPTGLISTPGPSRARLLGKWEVGEGNGDNFYITLRADGTALRSMGNVHGTWEYNNGAAEVTWEDGWQDAIRKVGGWYKKYAYSEGKTFGGNPDNVTNARNVSENPSGVD
jgi:hypothetical protein